MLAFSEALYGLCRNHPVRLFELRKALWEEHFSIILRLFFTVKNRLGVQSLMVMPSKLWRFDWSERRSLSSLWGWRSPPKGEMLKKKSYCCSRESNAKPWDNWMYLPHNCPKCARNWLEKHETALKQSECKCYVRHSVNFNVQVSRRFFLASLGMLRLGNRYLNGSETSAKSW